MPTPDRLLDSLPVKRKLLVLTLLTSAIALLMSAAVYSVYQLHVLRRDGERQLALIASVVAEQSRLALRYGDTSPLQSMLEYLVGEGLLDAALVAGDDGRPIAKSSRRGTTAAVLSGADAAGASGGTLVSLEPLLADGRAVGRIYLRGDRSGLYWRLTQEGLVGGGVLLASFALALLLSARLRRTISEPLESLSHAVRNDRSFAPPATADGDELGVLTHALRNFTERLRVHEGEDDRHRQLHAALLESIDDAVLLVEGDGVFSALNGGLARLLRQAGTVAAGAQLARLACPSDADAASDWLRRARAADCLVIQDLRLVDARGDLVPVRGRARALPTASRDGAAVVLVTFEDRRETVSLRDELELERQRLAVVDVCAEDGVLEVDARWRVVRASASTARLLGTSAASMFGQSFGDFDAAFDPCGLALRLEHGGHGKPVVAHGTLTRRDGTCFPARISWRALSTGCAGRVVATLRDLSDVVRAETALAAEHAARVGAEQERDLLIRNVGHDVRNPVTALVAAADILQREQGEEGRRRCIEMIDVSSRALLDVVNGLCDRARLGDGCLAPDCISFAPQPVLESILDVHAARARERDIALALHLDARLPPRLTGDPRLIRQLLAMLVGSVVRFGESGAVTVQVVAERGATTCRLRTTVHAHGAGLAGELREHLGLATAGRGAVAGSAEATLAQALCDAMHGRLDLEELPGGCYRLQLELQLAMTDADDAPPVAETSDRRLLLLHGDADIAAILSATCTDLGLRVTLADDAREAMALLRDGQSEGEPFAFALADGALPGREARNLLQAMHADSCLSQTRRLLISHLGDDDSAQGPADAVLVAPVRPSRLAAALASPVQAAAPDVGAVSRHGQALSPQAAPRILVADDDDSVQAALCFMLRTLGYAADGVSDGAAALAALQRRPYDAVVLDCRMPIMDGFETADALNGVFRVPVIAISASLTREDEQRLAALGVRACLAKPIKEASLIDVLRDCLVDATPH